MDWLINKVGLFNRWYDAQQEPGRFLLFLAAMSLAIVPMQVGLTLGWPVPALIGSILFGIMTFIATIRAVGMGGKHIWVARAVVVAHAFVAISIVVLLFL